jgi:formylmethanofuran dehydrogenase subunit A
MTIRLYNADFVDGQSTLKCNELFLHDGVIVRTRPDARVQSEYDLTGHVVVPAGIDIHTHIGGGKVNIARLMLPDLKSRRPRLPTERDVIEPLSSPVPGTWETGRRYLEMGYTACFEPAILPANARHAHAEMADTPFLDTGGYLLMGNDRLLLQWIREGVPQSQINDYVSWMVRSHQCCAVKVVNAGGIDAFKFNQRSLNVDEKHVHFQITPRQILRSLSEAVEAMGLAHPLHVHCSNLGVAGNIDSTLATIEAVEGRRLHLTHAQFHCYGIDGPHGYSSHARVLADRVNTDRNLSIDVGQMQFGQTVTLSGDTMHQFANRKLASPKKWAFQDLECQAGCGVLPFRYRESQYVHGLLWTIGLELFLRVLDPLRIYLTTDHPNGAPFTAYPHLIKLLMNYDYRMSIFERLHPDVQASSTLPSLKREYSLEEIIAMTRIGPARALGLTQRGLLHDGHVADIVVYERHSDAEAMFGRPKMVFRHGQMAVRDGLLQAEGNVSKSTFTASDADCSLQNAIMARHYHDCYGYSPKLTRVSDDELESDLRRIVRLPLRTSKA